MLRYTTACLLLFLLSDACIAGTGYEVTSSDGQQTVTYMVNFGGGRMFQQHTAYDPASKEFIYLRWKRGEKAPEPVSSIWDHRTGETIPLYQFPGAKHPLPVIPSIDAMKVCPKTGDKNFKYEARIAYD